MFVSPDFKQGDDCTIVCQFSNLVEITTPNPTNYQTWEVPDTDGAISKIRDDYLKLERKVKGIKYTLNKIDYLVPLRSIDALGVLQVNAAFTLGIKATTLRFSNGVSMPIASTEFKAFALWYAEQRNALFI